MRNERTIKSLCALALGLGWGANLALAGGKTGPVIWPPDTKPYGMSCGEWAVDWWQWALSIPQDLNPLNDSTGENATQGQPDGPVFFLAGTMGGGAERTVTVPAGKALFFPVVNSIWVNLEDFGDAPWSPKQEAFARRVIGKTIDNVYDVSCEIDGWVVKDILDYRCRTAQQDEFMVWMPDSSLWGLPGPATYGPSVDDGIYLMLAPLPAGQHTIHFTAAGATDPSVDVTYHLTVE